MAATTFNELPLSAELKQVLEALGFASPTAVQAAAIPVLLSGTDVIAQAMTGSGKTAAFGIPILETIDVKQRHTQALILCPTRELANQVAEHLRKLGRYRNNLRITTLYGGRPARLECRSLEHGSHIIVGTPGRILDHLGRETVDFSQVKWVVLDEADRMLDMGFRETMEQILSQTAHSRQTALFSATFPRTIEALSRRFQRNAQRITIATPKLELPEIEQRCYRASESTKPDLLVKILKSVQPQTALIFCNQKIRIAEVVRNLNQAGFSADALHGDLEQSDRERVMAKFRNLSVRFLVATDVAARGIDVAGLDAVINYDMPADPDQYVHRIGRTGRAGKKGLAVGMVNLEEAPKLTNIRLLTGQSLPILDPKTLVVSEGADPTPTAGMRTLSILGGRTSKLRAGDILGAITGEGGIKGDHVGKIEILERISYVAIARESASIAYQYLQTGKIKGRRFQVSWVK